MSSTNSLSSSSRTAVSYSDGYSRVSLEKPSLDEDKTDGGSSSSFSEHDGLMLHAEGRSHRRFWKKLANFRPSTSIILTVNGILLAGFLALAIITTLTIRRQVIYKAPEHNAQNGIIREVALEPKKYYNKSGLRTTADGILMECGSTNEEARTNGCIFDNWAYYYVPPACFDAEHLAETSSSEFRLSPHAGGDFPFYFDQERRELGPSDANTQASHYMLYAINKFHKAHCLYMLRLMNRALNRYLAGERDVYLLSATLQYGHTMHCMELIADPATNLSDTVAAVRANGRCIRLDEVMPGDFHIPVRIQI
ncbi:hypothetical protein F5Y15DRAFT_390808 [Xylariaceae sp. FL0016]|nr:hypothetical protein F5Y15DRAFT_390808 [Xylariaceae sp. FL0016]